ncbi:hypothetical protein ACHAPT_007257 [Fusarium lateritium]
MAQGAHDDEPANSDNGHIVEAIVVPDNTTDIQNNNEAPAVPLGDGTFSDIRSTTSNRTRALHALWYLDNSLAGSDVPPIKLAAADEPHQGADTDQVPCHNAGLLGSDLRNRAPAPATLAPSESGLSDLSQLSFCSIETVSDRGNAVQMMWEQSQSKRNNEPTPSGHPALNHSSQGTPADDHRVEPPEPSTHVNGVTIESDDDFEDINSIISNKICSSLVQSAFDKRDYLPLDQLREILSPPVVHQLLLPHFDEATASKYGREILGTQSEDGVASSPPRRRRIFAILVLANQVQRLAKFIQDDVDDRALPFLFSGIQKPARTIKVSYLLHRQDETYQEKDRPRTGQNRPNEPILEEFDVWPCHTARKFMLWQPMVHVPFLKFPGDKIYFYDLHQDSTLPFGKYDLQETGGYGSVRKVTIHPSHYNYCGNSEDQQPVCFAVKKPHVPNVNDYLQEIDPFDKLGIENKNSLSNHLIPLHLTFKHGRDYYLMFPWADGNLKGLWSKRKAKPEDPDEQIILGGKEWGRHGDIKPENILWFKNCEGRIDHLVISDFGLCQFNSAHSRSKVHQDQILGFSGTYRPPDLHFRNQPISQNYDVWSLGCVFLEFVSWFLLGYEETVVNFVQARMNDGLEGNVREDTFFAFEKDSHGTPRAATLRKSVVEWINKLHQMPQCSEPLHALLDLIHFTMLMPNSKERWKCSWVESRLRQLESKCNEDGFDAQGTPGGPDPNRYPDPPEKSHTDDLAPRRQLQKLAGIKATQDEVKEATPEPLGSSSTMRKASVPVLPGAKSPIQDESDKEMQSNHAGDTADGVFDSQTSRISPSTSSMTIRKPQSGENPHTGPDMIHDSIEQQLGGYGSQFDDYLKMPNRYGTPQDAFGDLGDDNVLNETVTNDTRILAQNPTEESPEPQPGKPRL